jgi:hypothetical protein
MADDKSKRGGPDRSRVAGGQDYEVDHFARRHGITAQQAKQLIDKHGNDRSRLDVEAKKLAGRE